MEERILRFADTRQFIGRIARSGENNTRSLAFDCSAALEKYPDAQIIAVIQRPQGDPYTVTPDADGTIRRITLTAYDLEFNGHLQVELRVIDGDKILKSAIYTATVDDSIRGEADAPGQPVRDVLDRLDGEIKKAQAVVDDIRKKLENGEFNGSDAEVTAANIQSALGYAPVKDVQVIGNSVLADGVANVPVASDTVSGVVKVNSWEGTRIDRIGRLIVYPSADNHIDRRASNTVITPTNIDYAIKSAMTDGKGAAWTADEQKAARERMGVDKAYELIEEITLTEDAHIIERTEDKNGVPYDLTAAYLDFLVKATNNGNSHVKIHYKYANESYYRYVSLIDAGCQNAKDVRWYERSYKDHGYWRTDGYQPYAAYSTDYYQFSMRPLLANTIPAENNIVGVKIEVNNEGVDFPAGSIIRIWGVRA